MRTRCGVAALLAAAGLAACGGSSPSSSSTATSSTLSAITTSTATMPSSSSISSSKTRSTLATSKIATSVRTAPPPIPQGTPAAPAGLAQTTGYATYENCSIHCSGAVPRSLRRALHLPTGSAARCRVGAGNGGPVLVVGSLHERVSSFIGSSWLGAEINWVARPGISGPILIRGRQLGDSGAVGFGEGRRPYDELQLYASAKTHEWPTFTRVRAPGCYAYQVDTATSSSVIVFEAAK